jgi:hypothetical protein
MQIDAASRRRQSGTTAFPTSFADTSPARHRARIAKLSLTTASLASRKLFLRAQAFEFHSIIQ